MNGSDDDIVRLYLREIARERLLTKEEEGELARTIELGRHASEELRTDAGTLISARRAALEEAAAAGERARQRFVRANLRLVVSVARRWARSGVPLLDLIQEGNLASYGQSSGSTTRGAFGSPLTPPGGSARPSLAPLQTADGSSGSRSTPARC